MLYVILHGILSWRKNNAIKQWSSTFLASGTGSVEDNFSMDWGWWGWFEMIQAHYIYCALYFYYFYISSSSDDQALDPEGWGSPAMKDS